MAETKRKASLAQNSQKNSQKGKRPRTENAAHLKSFRWPKGVSGNAGGRPKKRAISERYAFIAEIPLPEDVRKKFKMPIGVTFGDAGAIGTFLAMVAGKHGAAREIREAIEGKTAQRIEVVGGDSGPVKVSLAETIERIREFYGLGPPTTTPQRAADRNPLPS
jgi:hypothetical protein